MAAINSTQLKTVTDALVSAVPALSAVPSDTMNSQTLALMNSLQSEVVNATTVTAQKAANASVVKQISGH